MSGQDLEMVVPVTLQYLRKIRSGVSYKEDNVYQ